MSTHYSTEQQRYLDPGVRRFWPNFVVSAVLTPLMTVLLLVLTLPDNAVAFYIVTFVAVPVAIAAVLLPAWRLMRRERAFVQVATAVLVLPTLAVFLWCCYCDLWLLYLVATGQL
jgi:hypothetical protein